MLNRRMIFTTITFKHLIYEYYLIKKKMFTGSLPAGEFGANTRMEFCCRDDGFVSSPVLNIPNDKPVIMFMNNVSGSCQEIAGKLYTAKRQQLSMQFVCLSACLCLRVCVCLSVRL